MYENKPWLKFYGQVPHTLDYPRISMYEAVRLSAEERLDELAYDFLGYTSTYRRFLTEIDHCADALAVIGLQKGDKITISMPTSRLREELARLLKDAGYQGFLAVEIDFLHPDYKEDEDKAVASSVKELRRIADRVG